MPTATFSNRTSPVAALERTPDTPVVTASAAPAPLQAGEPSLVAHRAVEAVLMAVERFSIGDRHTVQLQFSVGGSDLSVRVELRGHEVHTTFRTDSAELRTALAQEWQAASSGSTDRPLRLASPVFSSNDHAGFSTFSGDTTSRQRDSRSHSEAEEPFSAVALRAKGTPSFGAVVDDFAASAPRTAAPGTALHLSTLA